MKIDKHCLPDGWRILKISDFGKICSGGTPNTNNSEYWDGKIQWITPSEVSKLGTRFVYKTDRTITELGLANSSATILPPCSVIVCTRATVGNCCINRVLMTTNQGFKSIIPNKNNISDFIYYLLNFYKKEIIRKACGSTFLEISKRDFENTKVLVPPVEEQKKIAEVLSTWDEGIENLEKLIALKEKQKRALMQRLLTGKTRLEGFSKLWKTYKLMDLSFHVTRKVNDKKVIPMSISAGIGFVPQLEKFGRNISGKQYEKYTLLKNKEFAYNKGNSKRFPQGCIYLLRDYAEIAIPNVFIAFKLNENLAINIFFEQLFIANFHGKELRKIINSGVRNDGLLNINTSDFFKLKILLPSAEEQKAIAEVLTSTDNEISQLKHKLELFKKQKKYLMQQLLTGKKRLV